MHPVKIFKAPIDDVLKDLSVDPATGLSEQEVASRREKHGENVLNEKKGQGPLVRFINQFKDFMVILLLIAALVSGLLGELKDSVIIAIVVVLNATLGLVQENKAEKSLEALRNLTSPLARVLRSGRIVEIRSSEIVLGDIVILKSGDYVPADGRIVEESNLKVEESTLTGESLPVDKSLAIPEGDNVPLGDRNNMVYSTSMVVYGRGKIIVTATGMDTEIGKIAKMLETEEKLRTPLQEKLDNLSKYLGLFALGVCFAIFLLGFVQGRDLLDMFMLAVAVAVAAIPEGLPAIVTIVLSVGVHRMAKKNAIVRRLSAVETLGAASIICSDKTGTLTQNKMTVTKLYVYDALVDVSSIKEATDSSITLLLQIGLLCNDASISLDGGEKKAIGDPTETALLMLAYQQGLFKREQEGLMPRVNEIPFDSVRKLMSTIHKAENGELTVFTKGAPELLLERCTHIYINNEVRELTAEMKQKIRSTNRYLANEAFRILGFAFKNVDEIPGELTTGNIENNLVFAGLMGLIDPPREEVKAAVKKCRRAGIRPVMLTGDYILTAMAIAKDLGIMLEDNEAIEGEELDSIADEELIKTISSYSVYARVSPEHKVRIVKAWQANGKIVSMTGDGVNDATALKAANIGCAMGITGTDVSKEAADIVLTDDNFATIVAAVEEGRSIYANIIKSIHYLLSSNVGETAAIAIALALNMPSPLMPIHILWINLVTDSLPAISLGMDPPEADIMSKRPRNPQESIFAGGLGMLIGVRGLSIGLVTLAAFYVGWKHSLEVGRTMAFSTLAFAKFGNSFSVRSLDKSIFQVGVFTNRYLIGGIMISTALTLGVIFIPLLRNVFSLVLLDRNQWLLVVMFSIIPLAVAETFKKVKRRIG